MRLWSSPPSTMCRQHLLGEHVETHMMVASLNRGKNLDGFYSGLIDTRLPAPFTAARVPRPAARAVER